MRILVVEDEKRLARALKRGLEEDGFAVDVAFDGDEGLWLANEAVYDAIVLDIMLPGQNGYQVCSALRAANIWTPILMLTAKEGELGSGERPTILTAGDLHLDPAQHRCWRGETEVRLTSRQFSLLEYLMRRAGDVISKSEILEHVWDYAFEGDINIVEVYVGYLRKKIDLPFDRKAIETIRLVGYRLDPDGG